MNDNQEHDVPNIATLNVTDITNVKHLRLPDNEQRESSIGSSTTTITRCPDQTKLEHLKYYTCSSTIPPKFSSSLKQRLCWRNNTVYILIYNDFLI